MAGRRRPGTSPAAPTPSAAARAHHRRSTAPREVIRPADPDIGSPPRPGAIDRRGNSPRRLSPWPLPPCRKQHPSSPAPDSGPARRPRPPSFPGRPRAGTPAGPMSDRAGLSARSRRGRRSARRLALIGEPAARGQRRPLGPIRPPFAHPHTRPARPGRVGARRSGPTAGGPVGPDWESRGPDSNRLQTPGIWVVLHQRDAGRGAIR
jgi:hypothetical protein